MSCHLSFSPSWLLRGPRLGEQHPTPVYFLREEKCTQLTVKGEQPALGTSSASYAWIALSRAPLVNVAQAVKSSQGSHHLTSINLLLETQLHVNFAFVTQTDPFCLHVCFSILSAFAPHESDLHATLKHSDAPKLLLSPKGHVPPWT